MLAGIKKGLVDRLKNVVILNLPPYSPELNPIEQVWHWMRQHSLVNRLFSGYEDIVNKCSETWDQFRVCTT